MTLTAASLRQQIREATAALKAVPAPPRVFFTTTAIRRGERLFPPSRHRSLRVLKKLLKRHGGEHRMEPAVYRINGDLYVHPALKAQFEALLPKVTR